MVPVNIYESVGNHNTRMCEVRSVEYGHKRTAHRAKHLRTVSWNGVEIEIKNWV